MPSQVPPLGISRWVTRASSPTSAGRLCGWSSRSASSSSWPSCPAPRRARERRCALRCVLPLQSRRSAELSSHKVWPAAARAGCYSSTDAGAHAYSFPSYRARLDHARALRSYIACRSCSRAHACSRGSFPLTARRALGRCFPTADAGAAALRPPRPRHRFRSRDNPRLLTTCYLCPRAGVLQPPTPALPTSAPRAPASGFDHVRVPAPIHRAEPNCTNPHRACHQGSALLYRVVLRPRLPRRLRRVRLARRRRHLDGRPVRIPVPKHALRPRHQ